MGTDRNENGTGIGKWKWGPARWEQKWGVGNGYWAEKGVLRDARTQGTEMGNVNGDWNGK